MIILDPPYGNMLGGTGVIVTGHRLVLSSNDDVMCTFDGIQTLGTYVSRWQALCVSPMLMRTGRVDFTLHVTGTNTFTGEGTFTSRNAIAIIIIATTRKYLTIKTTILQYIAIEGGVGWGVETS